MPSDVSAGRRPHFSALDGLRGLLALVVAIYHTNWLTWTTEYLLVDSAVIILDIFFVFSGFLMYVLYIDGIKAASFSSSDFMVKRVARLYPLHFFLIFVFVGWTCVRTVLHLIGFADGETIFLFQSGTPESFSNFVLNILMLNSVGLSDGLSFNAPSWTVGAEMISYLLFALLMPFAVRTGRYLPWPLILLSLASYFWLSRNFASLDITYNAGFIRCLAGFSLGMLVGICFKRGLFQIKRNSTLIEVAIILVMFAFIGTVSNQQQFLVAPFLFLFVIVFMQDSGAISTLLSKRPMGYLAKISYSVYLNHFIISILFEIVWNKLIVGRFTTESTEMLLGTIFLIPYLLVVIISSEFTYRFIEKPGSRLMMKMLQRERTRKTFTT